MALSGWCSQHGRPNHAGCRVPEACDCPCHELSAVVSRHLSAPLGTIVHKGTTNASAPEQWRGNATQGPRRTKDTTDVMNMLPQTQTVTI